MNCNLAAIVIGSSNLRDTVVFLESVLGWPVILDDDNYVELRDGSIRIGVYEEASFASNLGGAGLAPRCLASCVGRSELYVSVANPASMVRAAKAHGAVVLAEVTEKVWGDDVGYVLAPGGLVIGFASTRER